MQAVSKPKETGMYSFFKSASIVFGQPTTRVVHLCAAKFSANRHAFVLLSSPPITTRPSSSSAAQWSRAPLNCSGVSILSRPLPMMSKPPVLRYLEGGKKGEVPCGVRCQVPGLSSGKSRSFISVNVSSY